MECTICTIGSHTELHYWVQELTWVSAAVYDVSSEAIDEIRTCTTEQVQTVLAKIVATSKFLYNIS